jgi:hypothetical protein
MLITWRAFSFLSLLENPMFGMLGISMVVRVPQPMSEMGFRVKRVTVANIHCAYIERENVFTEFKKLNEHLRERDLCAEFKYTECL